MGRDRDPPEFNLLHALPADEVVKVRHVFQVGSRRFGLDVYEGRHQGLSILEVGVEVDADVSPPVFAGLEVSRDERFTGGGRRQRPRTRSQPCSTVQSGLRPREADRWNRRRCR